MPYYIRVNGEGIREKPQQAAPVFYGWDDKGDSWASHKTLILTNAVLVIQRDNPDARAFLWADDVEEVNDEDAERLYWS